MKILSVDDDPIFLEIIKSELLNLGYSDVHQVSSGEDALEAVRAADKDFDCFLLDIDMPGMDGVELCAQLRSHPRTQDVPILMVTSRAEMESVDRAFSVGATDYLNKPLNPRELRGRLKSTEALVFERAKRAAGLNDLNGGPRIDIEDAIRLDPSAGCIDYIAMQNFILKLGSMQMFNRVAIGVHVQNIHEIFANTSGEEFRDTLSDTAEILIDALGSCPKVMSYSGSGNFVVLVNRSRAFDFNNITESMAQTLNGLGKWYSDAGAIIPKLKVGKPVSRSLFSFTAPDEVLDEAIENACKSEIELSYIPPDVMPRTGTYNTTPFWK